MSNVSSEPLAVSGPLRQLASRWPSTKRKPDGGLGSPLRVIASVAVLFIASQMLAYLAVQAVLSLRIDGNTSLGSSAAAQFFYIFIAEGLAVYGVYRILKKRGLGLLSIGLGRAMIWKDLAKAALGFGVFYGLVIVASVIIRQFLPGIDLESSQDIGFNYLNTYRDSVLAFLALVILPPIGEEILMRGYLYTGLRVHWRATSSLVVTSLLFGAAHLQSGGDSGLLWVAGIHTFILSGVLVYLREKTGALYASILVHMFNNLLAFIVYF